MRLLSIALVLLVVAGTANKVFAGVAVGDDGKLQLYGDVRFRVEVDRDSRKGDGSMRDDRDRMRFRFRLGVDYQRSDHFSFGGRIRSGAPRAAQSPHQTLGDQFEPKDVHIDKAFIRSSWNDGQLWVGKNSTPFWQNDELFWDGDINPEGVALKQSFEISEGARLTASGGYFVLDSQRSNNFGNQAREVGAQVHGQISRDNVAAELAAGVYVFTDPDSNSSRLAFMDYSIFVVSGNVTLNDIPDKLKQVRIGFNLFNNTESYPDSLHNGDEKSGYSANVIVGKLGGKGTWLIGGYYANIEKYAVVARLAQDDWVRWGSATETRSSNFKGFELRGAVGLSDKNSVVVRYYDVEALELEQATDTAEETATRFRVDWNMKF